MQKRLIWLIVLILLSSTVLAAYDPARAKILQIPQEEVVQFNEAEHFFETGSYELALTAYQDFAITHPTSELADDAVYQTGMLHMALLDFDGAKTVFRTLEQHYPDSGRLANARAQIKIIDSVILNESFGKALPQQVVQEPTNILALLIVMVLALIWWFAKKN